MIGEPPSLPIAVTATPHGTSITDSAMDLVAADLAAGEAEFRERVIELEGDNRWLRETLHEAVAMLYRVNVQLDRARRSNLDLQQRLREHLRQTQKDVA
jgi:hypothetical protein